MRTVLRLYTSLGVAIIRLTKFANSVSGVKEIEEVNVEARFNVDHDTKSQLSAVDC